MRHPSWTLAPWSSRRRHWRHLSLRIPTSSALCFSLHQDPLSILIILEMLEGLKLQMELYLLTFNLKWCSSLSSKPSFVLSCSSASSATSGFMSVMSSPVTPAAWGKFESTQRCLEFYYVSILFWGLRSSELQSLLQGKTMTVPLTFRILVQRPNSFWASCILSSSVSFSLVLNWCVLSKFECGFFPEDAR